MRKLHSLVAATALALTVAVATEPDRASAVTLDVTFTATSFFGWSPVEPTGETPPVDGISGSFSLTTEGEQIGLDGEPSEPRDGLPPMAPLTALDLEIAGHPHLAEDAEAYVGFVAGQLTQVTAGARIKPAELDWPGGLVQYPGFDDWSLGILLEDPRSPDTPASVDFSFSTAESASLFGSYSLEVSLSIDGGPPRQLAYDVPACIEAATLCHDARPSPADPPSAGSALDASAGVKPGALLCDAGSPDEARSPGAATLLRDVRIARASAADAERSGLPRRTKLATALGSLTLELKAVDRLLLTAARGESSAVQPPEAPPGSSLRCARARTAPGTPRFAPRRNLLIEATSGDRAYYHVRKPTRVCVSDATPEAAELLLCYRARPAAGGRARSETWVAHALGVEHLKVGGAGEICLPANRVEAN
jgi:hypothetical protein